MTDGDIAIHVFGICFLFYLPQNALMKLLVMVKPIFKLSGTVLSMATRNVAQLHTIDSLEEAAALMADKRISSVVVVHEDSTPGGIVTERTILAAMQQGRRPETLLSEVMSSPVISIPEDMEAQEAYLLCLREDIRHLVVVDQNNVVIGVLSETDFRLHLNLTTLAGRHSASAVMSRSVLSIPQDTLLQHALEVMHKQNEACIVIVEEAKPVGVLTERDVVRLYRERCDLAAISLKSIMSSPVVQVSLGTTLRDIAEHMLETKLRHIVVVDHFGELAGLISEHELTQFMAFGVIDAQSRANRTLLRTLLDSIPDMVWLKDPNGVYLACNARFQYLYAASEKEILGQTDFQFVDEATADRYQNEDLAAIQAKMALRHEEWLQFAGDGVDRLMDIIKAPVTDRGGRLIGTLGIARDITDRKRAEMALIESRSLLNAVMDSTDNMIWSVAADSFGLLTFNAGFQRYFLEKHGISIVKGMRPDALLPTPDYVERWQQFYRRALAEGAYSIEYETPSGCVILQLNFNLLRNESGVFGISVFGEDITAQKSFEARVQYLAYHDALTDLPNLALVEERFKLAQSYASRAKFRLAVLLLDIDNFKTINDALGHRVGDNLLKEIAVRLSSFVRASDTVSRQSGDSFLILLTDLVDMEDVAAVASKIISSLPTPISIDSRLVSVTASMGVAIYPDDAVTMDGLMKKAHTALYVAKDSGRNHFCFFDERFNSATAEMLALRSELQQAIERDEFILHYQPRIDLKSGKLIGTEALIRWKSPTRGLVPPGVFIPIAEETGLIVPIGDWVLTEAIRQTSEWRRAGFGDNLSVAVNISTAQFMRGNLGTSVMAALRAHELDPTALVLELTESILIKDSEELLAALQELKREGIQLAIDDFGTGYSSLSYLQRFPIDILKIDQSFVRTMMTEHGNVEIVRATIQMANALGMKTTAEGIEDKMTAQHLESLNCDEGQGYYFSPPLSAKAFANFVGKIH